MENIKFRLRIKVGLNNYFECFSVLATTSCESLVTWKKKKCRFDWTNYLNGMLGNEDKDIFISSTKDVQKPSYKKKNRKKKVECHM